MKHDIKYIMETVYPISDQSKILFNINIILYKITINTYEIYKILDNDNIDSDIKILYQNMITLSSVEHSKI